MIVGCNIKILFGLQEIDSDNLIAYIKDDTAGAVVGFEGTVRNENAACTVRSLTYEAYEPMAREQIQAVCEEAATRWNLKKIAVQHRLGKLAVGDTAVLILVSAPHRREAFQACAFIIDEIKGRVPIWKREETEKGSRWLHEGTGPPATGT